MCFASTKQEFDSPTVHQIICQCRFASSKDIKASCHSVAGFNSLIDTKNYGAIVYRLGHKVFILVSGVRFPVALPSLCRGSPLGRASDCLSDSGGFDSRPRRQFYLSVLSKADGRFWNLRVGISEFPTQTI